MATKKRDKTLPTIDHNTKYQGIFDYFNESLFDSSLHSCMLIFTRNNNIVCGYFAPDKWVNESGQHVHEIAVNANRMNDEGFPDLMNTIIHEMVHLEQHLKGNGGRKGYHNKAWVDRATELGLEVIGSGQSVDTKLIPGGIAETVCALMPDELIFDWTALDMGEVNGPNQGQGQGSGSGAPGEPAPAPVAAKSGQRTRYICPVCGAKVWGKAGLRIMCMTDDRGMIEGE